MVGVPECCVHPNDHVGLAHRCFSRGSNDTIPAEKWWVINVRSTLAEAVIRTSCMRGGILDSDTEFNISTLHTIERNGGEGGRGSDERTYCIISTAVESHAPFQGRLKSHAVHNHG